MRILLKSLLLFCGTGFSVACFSQLPGYVSDEGLVAWYPLETNGEDAASLELDASLTSIQFVNDPEKGNVALLVEDQNQILCPDEEQFDFVDEFSIVGDFKLQSGYPGFPSNHHMILWNKESSYELGLSATQELKYAMANSPNGWNWVGTGIFLDADIWYHIGFTWNGDTVKVLIDGVLLFEDLRTGALFPAYDALRIGARSPEVGDASFYGRMRQVGIYSRGLSESEVSQLAFGAPLLFGCTDSLACNYDPEAIALDASCIYGCQSCGAGTFWDEQLQVCLPEPGQDVSGCGPGTVWNPEVGECVIAVPSDTDFDGCVTAGDVLNLLAAFGTCPPVPEWPDVEDEAPSASIDCADSVLYYGHYYQTVVIGEQCWFAENLRTTQYNESDPDTPLQVVQPSEWASVNGEGLWNGVACVNPMALDTSLGLLYNHHAVFGNGNVCPTDWRVPTTIDWAVLEMELGGSADEVGGVIGWRAYGVGEALKAPPEGGCCSEFGWDGSGISGFDAVPSGSIHPTGEFANTNKAFFWTSDTWSSIHGWRRKLGGGVSAIMNEYFFMDGGMSVRCVKY